jgi:GTPase SAR1 family protein
MGGCVSTLTEEEKIALKEQQKMSKQIEAAQKKAQDSDEALKKLLLLGAGESGKSTLFKQMVSLYGSGYSEQERVSFRPVVFANTITAMKILIESAQELSLEIGNCKIEEKNKIAAERLTDLMGDECLTTEIITDIQELWSNDNGIKETFANRSKFQFPDSGPYFFDRMTEMIKEDYIPTQNDVLRSRVRTTGIVETGFELEGNKFKMFDVGGQRNERKKWIHCFENVTCVIFVAAISEYDQVLFEDETTNRVVEALELFDEICNSKWFTQTSIILFLNKRDLFMDKIIKVKLGEFFEDYCGPANDYEAGCEFFRCKFDMRNRCADKDIYTHVTCATDSGNIAHVFESVKDILIKQSLRDGGLF